MTDPHAETQSYLVSRPLAIPVAGHFASHNFVVTHARFPGDPTAKVHSFGSDGEHGRVDRVDLLTNGFSRNTHVADRKAWLAMKDDPRPNDLSRIDAPCGTVESHARSVRSNQDYRLVPVHSRCGNSNSAAQAVADRAAGKRVPTPGEGRIAPGSDSRSAARIQFRNEENLERLRERKSVPSSRDERIARLKQRANRTAKDVRPVRKKR